MIDSELIMKIDFSQVSYEEFEFLVEDLLEVKGFTIVSRPARGSDRGKDIIAVRDTKDDMGVIGRERYLVECKHFKKASVKEADIGNWQSKMQVHQANRYLLVTSSLVSETVKDQLAALTADNGDNRSAIFWARSDLQELLLRHSDVKNKYFFSWEEEAEIAANYLGNHHFSAHRGAILWTSNVTAVFGNDGYSSNISGDSEATQRTRKEVEGLKQKLLQLGTEELAFELSPDGYSWVVLVKSDNAKELNDLVWDCYPSGSSSNNSQYEEAAKRLRSYWDTPFKELS